jgi:hypothetical protein
MITFVIDNTSGTGNPAKQVLPGSHSVSSGCSRGPFRLSVPCRGIRKT